MGRWMMAGLLFLFLLGGDLGRSSDFLVLFWAFDDGKTKEVTNVVNSEEGKGVLKGNVDLVEGVRGFGVDFYDQDGFYVVKMPDEWVFSGRGVSFAFWLKHRGFNPNTILLKSGGITIKGDPVYEDRLCLELDFSNGDKEIFRCPVSLPEDEWVHFAVSIGKGRIEFFVNGKSVYLDSYWEEDDKLIRDRDVLREVFFVAGDGTENRYSGRLDEFAVFSHRIDEYECAGLI